MTRETKLGLLIGTGIILLIGIVVSDHLTVVQKHDAPPAAGYADTSSNVPAPTPGIVPGNNPGIAPAPGNPGGTPAGDGLTSLTGDPVPAFSLTDNRTSPGMIPGTTLGTASNATPGNPGTAINLFDPAPPSNEPLPMGNVVTPGTTPGVTSGRTEAGSILHVVKSGETLWDIAKKYYSDGNKWQTIADANKSLLSRGLQEGMKLTIPNLARATPAGTPPENAPDSAAKTITVAQGDTLAKLAAKHLGSAGKWPELLKANSDKLKKAEQLKVGMVLRLPETKAETRTDARKADATVATPGGNGGKTYTVVAGDSLYAVAKKTLGNANRWKEILEANKDTLKGKTNLTVGQKLVIPDNAPPVRDQVSTPATPVTTTLGPATAPTSTGDGMMLLLDDAGGAAAPTPAGRPVL